jgi:hypothetical protein
MNNAMISQIRRPAIVLAGVLVAACRLGAEDAPVAKTVVRPMVSNTMDQSTVPYVVESKTVNVDASTKRTESVVRQRQGDDMAAWLRITKTTKQEGDDKTVSTTEVVETDRQGKSIVKRTREETVVTASDGAKTVNAREYRRNSSGQLVPDVSVSVTEQRDATGKITVHTVAKQADVNGNMVPQSEVTQTIVSKSDQEKQVTSVIKSFNHVEAKFDVAATEVSTVKTDGNATLTEVEVRQRTRTGDEVTGRTVTREVRADDGTRRRESVEYGRTLYAQSGRSVMADPLQPQRKFVEWEERKADGTIVLRRDMFRRDVNGDWTPVSFSTQGVGDAMKWPLD